MSDLADTFRAAFLPHRAKMEEAASARLRAFYADARRELGPSLRGVYNHPRYARMWSETMKHFVENAGGTWDLEARARRPDDYVVSEERLSAFLSAWSAAALEDAAQKLAAKVADLEEVEVSRVAGNGGWFTVYGKRGGTMVRVEQQQILNVSSRGKLYNQWPALIYVNGKKVSEAAYKRG